MAAAVVKHQQHSRDLKAFEALRDLLRWEIEETGDSTVFSASGCNQAVAQTVEQVIGFEREALAKLRRQWGDFSQAVDRSSERSATGGAAVDVGESSSVRRSRRCRALAVAPGHSVPQSLQCPITGEVMLDPVVTTDGHTYEREAIQRYLPVTPLVPHCKFILCTR